MKRCLVRICVFLLLGAIVNVAVAWHLAINVRPLRDNGVIIDPPAESEWLSIDTRSPFIALSPSEAKWLAERGYSALPLQTRFRDVLSATGRRDIRYAQNMLEFWSDNAVRRVDCGWPMFSFSGRVNPLYASASFPTRVLPYPTAWPGFAINTVFYAGVLWMLFAAPFALRRRSRRRRGLCVKCGYDLRGPAARTEARAPNAERRDEKRRLSARSSTSP